MTIHPRIPPIDLDTASRDRLIGHIDALEDILQTLLPAESDSELSKLRALGLTRTQARMLACLTNGRTQSRQQLRTASRQWGDEYETKSVDVIIHHIRKKLHHHGIEIRNDWGTGFYMEPASITKMQAILAEEG